MSSAEEYTAITLKFDENDEHGHQLFVKENSSRLTSGERPSGRTLYVLNVPPYATKEALREVFAPAGLVENVELQVKSSSKEIPLYEISSHRFAFKVAYVVFKESASLKKLLQSKKINPLNANGMVLTGVAKWTKAFQDQLPDPAALQHEINEYMKSYDAMIREKKNAESGNTADADGWVTVTKKSSAIFSQKESVVKKLEKKLTDDRSTKQLKNFYTFQIRESKKNDIISLRKKYDRDLKKMEQIKQAKRFKPY